MKQKQHLKALKPGYKLHWYEIKEILGQGGFGITYLALDLNLDHEVAIKEYLPVELSARDETGSVQPVTTEHAARYQWGLERFIEEARTIGRFKHPNIVRVRNVFEANNTGYLVMDYELGESLQEILSRRKTLSEEDLKSVILPIIDGMRHVHAAGFIHRDVKPANIFIRVDGDPVLLDFGSARRALEESQKSLTSIFSRGYAPIEQYNTTDDTQGPWTDIYSVGATLYRGIAGVPPTDAVDRSAAISHTLKDTYVSAVEIGAGKYSTPLLEAIDHALQFKQQDRPQSIGEWNLEFTSPRKEVTLPPDEVNVELDSTAERNNVFLSTLKAAESGDIVALSNIGFMYAKGIGATKNEEEAVKWYKKAAEKGHLNSQFNLGVIYAKGRGVTQDYAESFKWYKMAAEQGDVTAQSTLAMMYAKGIGTEKNEKQAVNWYHRAAVQNHVNSQYILANMFAKGRGVPRDETEAFEWYQKAAEQGHINAQIILGYMFGKGKGVERDDVEAFHWYSKAAEQGHPNAQFNLGVIYAKGRGIHKDIEVAKKWYQKAADQGDDNAVRALERLG